MLIDRKMMRSAVATAASIVVVGLFGQAPRAGRAPNGASPVQPAPAGGAAAFPARPPADPGALARGKAAYATNCAYCHGEDARGGAEGGTNLLRSDYFMKDHNGESLRSFLLNANESAHAGVREGVLKFNFSDAQVDDISTYIRDFRLSSRDPGRMRPPTIVVGDASAGEKYFKSRCAVCHSVTGDLSGIANKFTDPRTLQQKWLMPVIYSGRGGTSLSNVTVTVTLADGQAVDGRLERIDDFMVTLIQADGTPRSFDRQGDRPKVDVHDPMQPHRELLHVYTDKDIHDVTAYLETLR